MPVIWLIKVYLNPSRISAIVICFAKIALLQMFECLRNRPLKSDWFFTQIPRNCDPGNLKNSERGDSSQYLLLEVTNFRHRIVNNNVNMLQFSDFKVCCYGSMSNGFSYFTSFTLLTGSLSSIESYLTNIFYSTALTLIQVGMGEGGNSPPPVGFPLIIQEW